jgi:hypothetical protein
MVSRAWRWRSTSSLVSAITRFEHHWTTVISFGDYRVRKNFPPPTSLQQLEDVLIHIHIHIHLFAFISVIGTKPSRYRTCQSNMLHAFHTQ